MVTPITFARYVTGDETLRLAFERQQGGDLYEHKRIYDPWPTDEARELRLTALHLLRGDEWHRKGRCRRGRPFERMSCGTCALHGYEPRGGWEDGHRVKRDGPNYAGWHRVYVEAGKPIPESWRHLIAEGVSDNDRYMEALGRDIATFGHPGFV